MKCKCLCCRASTDLCVKLFSKCMKVTQHILLCLIDCVCLSVCLFITTMSCAKTAEPVEMLLSKWTPVGPRNHLLAWGPDPPKGEEQFWGSLKYMEHPVRVTVIHICICIHSLCYRPYYPTARFRSHSSFIISDEPFLHRSKPMSC